MQKRVGFVAQELEAAVSGYDHFKHIVGSGTIVTGENEETPIKTVDYSRLVVVLWGVCKGLEKRVAILEAR